MPLLSVVARATPQRLQGLRETIKSAIFAASRNE